MEDVIGNVIEMLDLPFVQDNSEALSTVIIESYSKLISLTTLVWSASHFPSLSRSGHIHSTFGTFSHRFHLRKFHYHFMKTNKRFTYN